MVVGWEGVVGWEEEVGCEVEAGCEGEVGLAGSAGWGVVTMVVVGLGIEPRVGKAAGRAGGGWRMGRPQGWARRWEGRQGGC